MTCFEAQSMITKYLNDELSYDELESFLDHISTCENCREELEIYYTLITGMKQLDEDKVLTSNFHKALEKKLMNSRNLLIKRQKKNFRKAIFLCVIVLIISMSLSFESSQRDDKDMPVFTNAKESVYDLKYDFDRYYYKNIDEFVSKNNKDIKKFVISVEEQSGK